MTKVASKRGSRLHLSKETIEGDILTGKQAIEEGLVDELGIFKDVVERNFPGSQVSDLVSGFNHPLRGFTSNLLYVTIIGRQRQYFTKLMKTLKREEQ